MRPGWLGRLGRWLAPSAAAACTGALVAGLAESADAGAPATALAAAGFVAVFAIPALFVASAALRALVAAWQPDALAALAVDEDGAAPELAGWIAVLSLGALALGLVMYRATWWMAASTSFLPLSVGFAAPVFAVATALAVVAASRPAARAFAALARYLDARWRRRRRRTLLRPRWILGAAAAAWLGAGLGLWLVAVRPRLGPLDTSVVHAPLLGLGAAVAVHLAWPRLGRRARLAGGAGSAILGAAAVAVALATAAANPVATLEIWGDRPVAGVAIDALYDLDAIRTRISLAQFRPVDRPEAEHPDIVFITIDTVRADHTPPYGGRADMPILRELGARGTVFEWAFAPSNVTRRSVPSMVIGLAPNRIRGRVVGWALRLDPRHVLLAERLRAGGYETAGFMCCQGLFSIGATHTGWARGLEHVEVEGAGVQLAARARAWLSAREQRGERRPLFLWMHIIEPHNWTANVGEPRNEAERHRFYDRSLAQADAMLADVLRPFAMRAPERAPIVIVTADHGEALGDHGHEYHSNDLYNSQVRVPLVVAGPGIKSHRIAETVSLTDLVPTIVELAGFRAPAGKSIDGRSLADLATGARASEPGGGTAFAAMIKDRSNPGGVSAIVVGPWKLIDDGERVELYQIHDDPDELRDLAAAHPDKVRELRAALAAKHAAAQESPFD